MTLEEMKAIGERAAQIEAAQRSYRVEAERPSIVIDDEILAFAAKHAKLKQG